MTSLVMESDWVEDTSHAAQEEEEEVEDMDVTVESQPIKSDLAPNSGPGVAGEAAATAPTPSPSPLLRGTLSYNLQARRHILRGMWNYETSTEFSPQRFELIRNLAPEEDPAQLPQDGEFHGSFSLSYFVITPKGKRKERTKVISETGVRIRFELMAADELPESERGQPSFRVFGEGTNQFGVFQICGTAAKSALEGDPTLHVQLRKKYVAVPSLAAVDSYNNNTNMTDSSNDSHKLKKRKLLETLTTPTASCTTNPNPVPAPNDSSEQELALQRDPHNYTPEALPPPSPMYDSNVVCLRGTLTRESYNPDEVVHKISGLWSSGLNFILNDLDNSSGLCNRFEYEHKSSGHSDIFPLSGRYMGWFNLTLENGSRTRIVERDVVLKFRKNNAGFYNVEGKGSNVFGKYTITGTINDQHIITIFRHFQPIKVKNSQLTLSSHITTMVESKESGIPLSTTTNTITTTTTTTTQSPHTHETLRLDDIAVPSDDSTTLPPLEPPLHGQYSAVSRGVLRANEDGAHTCSGKWAITREHYNQNIFSNFYFGLEADQVQHEEKQLDNSSTANGTLERPFPVDSAFYKGSFKIRRGTTKFQTVVDRQIVLKFRKNNAGTFNVYGKGINDIGTYDLLGTLILSGRASGHVELYRMYPIPSTTPSEPVEFDSSNLSVIPSSNVPAPHGHKKSKAQDRDDRVIPHSSLPSSSSIPPPPPSLMRRESSRLIKVPLRLEDDDPLSQSARIMEKCSLLLKVVREKDAAAGSFFAIPVDPVTLNLPTYHQIIKHPMDLGTIQQKMDSNSISSPEQFATLVRLVFENAIKFNDDPSHIVNITARNMLSLFNSKYLDIQKIIDNINREKKMGKDSKWGKFKDDKKMKKRGEMDDPKTAALVQLRLSADEATNVLDSLSSSYSAFDQNVLIQMFRLLQTQTNCIQKYLVALHSEKSYLSAQDIGTTASVSSSVLNKSFESYVERKPKKTKKRISSEYDFGTSLSSSTVMKSAPPPPSKPVPDVVVHMDDEPLTHEEQQELTEAINSMSVDKLKPVADIIRESAALHDEDTDEIEIDINQLDTATQRKLQRYVMKNVKLRKPKKHIMKKMSASTKSSTMPLSTRHPGKSKPTTSSHSLFAFGGSGEDHEFSDLDEDVMGPIQANVVPIASHAGTNSFLTVDDAGNELNSSAHGLLDDNDEEMGLAANWNFSSSSLAPRSAKDVPNNSGGNDEKDEEEDDAWAAARGASEAQKALDKERLALEEKVRADAEAAKGKHMAEAAAIGKKKLLERKEKEAEEVQQRLLKEQEERERAQKAREHAFLTLQSIQPTVDLDAQRDVMKEYEQSFYDKDLGGGESPSSDFGF